jgi:hypothetical protein
MDPMNMAPQRDRTNEWFVPRFGPQRFRVLVGLLFLPYTGMVLAFTVLGAMLADTVHWDRVGALLVIYFLALGIGAHALDAVGSKARKPWGAVFSRAQLVTLATLSIVAAYAIGLYYIVIYAPWLAVIALLEGFFLLAYNLEWLAGRFHTDRWFALSWGALPVLAGYALQTNTLSVSALLVAGAAALLSLVEITASRPYKELKRASHGRGGAAEARRLEAILRYISLGTIILAAGLAAARWE